MWKCLETGLFCHLTTQITFSFSLNYMPVTGEKKKKCPCCVWWHTLLIPALEARQASLEFRASQGYIGRACLKNKQKKAMCSFRRCCCLALALTGLVGRFIRADSRDNCLLPQHSRSPGGVPAPAGKPLAAPEQLFPGPVLQAPA